MVWLHYELDLTRTFWEQRLYLAEIFQIQGWRDFPERVSQGMRAGIPHYNLDAVLL